MPLLLPPPNSEEQTIYSRLLQSKTKGPLASSTQMRSEGTGHQCFSFCLWYLLPRLIPDKQFTRRGALPPTSPTYRIEATATWPCYADNSRALIIPDPAHAVEVLHQEKQAERTQDQCPLAHQAPISECSYYSERNLSLSHPLISRAPLEILTGGKQQEAGGQVCLISSQKA